MDSILASLFNGKIMPLENLTPNDPEFPALKQKAEEEKAYFKSILSAEDYALLDSMEETSDIISEMENAEAFSRGFRIAVKIMVEVYHNENELPDILKLLSIDKSGK